MSMEGKIALVTGASRGIGRAIALQLGQQGVTVVGTATTPEGAEKITASFNDAGIKGAGYALDVCNVEHIDETLGLMTERFGSPGILVNNAGITRDNLMLRMSKDQWDAVIDTNLSSIFRMTKACLKPMVKARWGRIISIASIVGVIGNPGQANYAAAKAGLIGFSKSLGQEIAARGVTVNVVAPGFIETDMTASLAEAQQKALLDTIPMKRMGQAEDIAQAVHFLASEGASYITGQTLHVNGGMCMV